MDPGVEQRRPAEVDRTREGRHPLGHRGHRQRVLGPLGQAGEEAGLEVARRHDPGADRLSHRL